jgi:hypothetical protein
MVAFRDLLLFQDALCKLILNIEDEFYFLLLNDAL